MGTNAVSLPHTKNETSGSVYHALQLREQSARKTNEERTCIVNTREDERLNKALSSKRIEKAPNFANTPQVKEGLSLKKKKLSFILLIFVYST